MPSSLNMEYVNYLTDVLGAESKDQRVLCQMIVDSKAADLLKSMGYKSIHFSSGWGPTDYNPRADLNVRCGRWSEFAVVLVQTTMLCPFEKHLVETGARERVLCIFSRLAEVPRIEGPKFVFAHVISPHPPYLFDANGDPVPDAELEITGKVWAQTEDYLNQLIFVSKKLQELVDAILSRSEVSPIIILQADHGPASTFYRPDSGGWDHPTETNLRERMRIFNAYHLPAGGDDLLYDTITPVNTFRLIFDFYFGADCGLLDDRSYYSPEEYLYDFVDVTDEIGPD